MNETIHVELDVPCDAEELIAFLATRGLAGTVTSTNDHCEIEIGFADSELRLRQEFEAALTAWLAVHDRPLVPVIGREHEYVLRPPGD